MITIGGIYSGPELEGGAFNKAVSRAAKAAMQVCGSVDSFSGPSVNVVFCVPGSLGRPDWDHGRIARYSSKRKLLLIQIAVPEEVVDGNSPLEFLISELHGANAMAFEFYRQKGVQYPLAAAERLVAEINDSAMGTETGTQLV